MSYCDSLWCCGLIGTHWDSFGLIFSKFVSPKDSYFQITKRITADVSDDIYLKLGVCIEQSVLTKETIQNAF